VPWFRSPRRVAISTPSSAADQSGSCRAKPQTRKLCQLELGECLFERLACGQCVEERGAGLDRQPSLRLGPHMISGMPPILRRAQIAMHPATQRASVP
jgi:hypothetical protein